MKRTRRYKKKNNKNVKKYTRRTRRRRYSLRKKNLKGGKMETRNYSDTYVIPDPNIPNEEELRRIQEEEEERQRQQEEEERQRQIQLNGILLRRQDSPLTLIEEDTNDSNSSGRGTPVDYLMRYRNNNNTPTNI